MITKRQGRYGLGALATYESALAWQRFEDRKRVYAEARTRADATHRPLVVVGDPDGGAHTRLLRAYPCGDVTVDLHGAPSCPVSISADITKPTPLPPEDARIYARTPGGAMVPMTSGDIGDFPTKLSPVIPPNSSVVFISCVFEYVDDPVAAYNECLRMAGTRENLFVVRVQPYSFTSDFYPGAKWTMHNDATGNVYFEPVTLGRKLFAAAVLASLGYISVKGQ